MLYIRSFLHQTTTRIEHADGVDRCISVLFYIKPQLSFVFLVIIFGCISVLFYIKPQLVRSLTPRVLVVYPFFSTSNHNIFAVKQFRFELYIRSFLHQTTTDRKSNEKMNQLYIRSFLHQTTTICLLLLLIIVLYIRSFLHQTTTTESRYIFDASCISVLFYIKPQPAALRSPVFKVVYPFFSTSNHNMSLLSD